MIVLHHKHVTELRKDYCVCDINQSVYILQNNSLHISRNRRLCTDHKNYITDYNFVCQKHKVWTRDSRFMT
jgi:hypothetical protein